VRKKAPAVFLILAALAAGLYIGLKKNIDTAGMQSFETDHFRVWYSTLAEGTKGDVGRTLEGAYPRIAAFFGAEPAEKTAVILYPGVGDFQRAYLGHILSWFHGDWAAGAEFEGMVLAASPENPGADHTYEDILLILVHEYVHSRIRRINEFPNVWLDEGLATYLAEQESRLPDALPAFDDFRKDNMGVFLANDGYAVGFSFIAYLDQTYGSAKVLDLIRSGDYKAVFGKPAAAVYAEWVRSWAAAKP
jgi:RNA polymerase sigma-70 factor (ECF subfamily)